MKPGWEGKAIEWGEIGRGPLCAYSNVPVSWCAETFSVHKMVMEHRCYRNVLMKLQPQAICISHMSSFHFQSGSADRRMSLCRVGQQGRKAELCSAQTDRPDWDLGRERRSKQCGGGKKDFINWCWGQTSCGSWLVEVVLKITDMSCKSMLNLDGDFPN